MRMPPTPVGVGGIQSSFRSLGTCGKIAEKRGGPPRFLDPGNSGTTFEGGARSANGIKDGNCILGTNLTENFGNVTGNLGSVTERTGLQDWCCACPLWSKPA